MSAAEDARPARALIAPRTVLALVLVAAVSFCAYFALLSYAPDLRTGLDGGPHALSRSAVGFAGWVKLLRELKSPVVVSRGDPRKPGAGGLLVLTPPPDVDVKDIAQVRFGAPILLVLPKWSVSPDPLRRGWVDKQGLLEPKALARIVGGLTAAAVVERRTGPSRPVLSRGATALFAEAGPLPLGSVDSLQTVSGADLSPVLVDERGKTVLALSRKRPMFILADPDVLDNQGLAQLADVRAAKAMLDGIAGPGAVVFDVTLNGFTRGRSLLRLMLEPPLLGATLSLLAAAALIGWRGLTRFGPAPRPVRALALGARPLADNSAALVRMARREPRMGSAYAVLTREQAAWAVGTPRDLDAAQLNGLLDRLGRARGAGDFSELAVKAQLAKTNPELVQAARRLFQWKLEMTRERR